ncbi:hypothetical protein [uncultured Microbacterium sp.]|uniref:hypothetical protein n=1 Tax=uncultured Microbacterium sp. TaxID=191216 RepID=UPI0025E6D049|nr:hypothetical protein [uncultured Microbacterium sp.]
MSDLDEVPVGASARCPEWWPGLRVGIWVVIIVLAVPVVFIDGIVVALVTLRNATYTTNVTISLSYLNDAGRTYSCTYDYSTPNDAPMPPAIARQMNNQDWSATGQQMYEWSKTHRAAEGSTWGLAMEEFVKFPGWQVDTPTGSTHELWWQERPGSNCEDGLR